MKESVLYQSSLVEIGLFSIAPKEPQFQQPGFVASPIIVFPKNNIWIEHQGAKRFVADATCVNLYNKNQSYNRYAINPSGDHCHWFRVSDAILRTVTCKEQGHFGVEKIPCPNSVFIQHIKVLQQLLSSAPIETLKLEAQVLDIFHELLAQTQHMSASFGAVYQRNKLVVENVKASIQADLSVSLSLQGLSELHHMSPYHLSRMFKQITGQGIHQYRTQLRLRTLSLELKNRQDDLLNLALDFGFSSHSHMTASFKKSFGVTPSQWAACH